MGFFIVLKQLKRQISISGSLAAAKIGVKIHLLFKIHVHLREKVCACAISTKTLLPYTGTNDLLHCATLTLNPYKVPAKTSA